jgi:acetyltransferase (GNAT) family protein
MNIRKATANDAAPIAAIIMPVIREGTTYTLDPDMSESEALAYWMGNDKETFVAEQDGAILGTYYMRPNQAGGGRHVCNCGYMTQAGASGRGIARRMCEHSLGHARLRIAPCSLILWSARTSAPYGCGSHSGLRSSVVCRLRSDIRRMGMSTHLLCTNSCSLCVRGAYPASPRRRLLYLLGTSIPTPTR